MNPRDFVLWLQGFLDAHPKEIGQESLLLLEDKLAEVDIRSSEKPTITHRGFEAGGVIDVKLLKDRAIGEQQPGWQKSPG